MKKALAVDDMQLATEPCSLGAPVQGVVCSQVHDCRCDPEHHVRHERPRMDSGRIAEGSTPNPSPPQS